MTPMVGFLCMLSALVSTGYSISCELCTAKNMKSCKGKYVTCPEGRVCGSSFLNSSGEIPINVIKACFQKSDCDKQATFTSDGVKFSLVISCCFTDKCSREPTALNLPPGNKTVNGLVCPTCESKHDTKCSSWKEMQCTGNENFCFSQFANISGRIPNKMVLHGCASESLCQVGNISMNSEINSTINCTKANVSNSINTTKTPTVIFTINPRIDNRDAGNSTTSANNTGTWSAGFGLQCILLLETVVFLMLINPLTLNG